MEIITPMQAWAINHGERRRNMLILACMCVISEIIAIPLLKLAHAHFNWQSHEFLHSAHYMVPVLILAYFMLAIYWVWVKDNLELNKALKQSAWE